MSLATQPQPQKIERELSREYRRLVRAARRVQVLEAVRSLLKSDPAAAARLYAGSDDA